MSRKRDTNWSRDEITVLLDSITEITRMRANDGKRTNSREVFEYAAKKMGEKGHTCRAEREKCRTKWKKMKEEFTYAKKARDGDHRFREAPGILPFYSRMEEFINGSFENISPHSTIVRRASSSASRRSSGQRTSARIAANTNGSTSTDNNDTSSSIVTRTNTGSEFNSTIHAPSDASFTRQTPRLVSSGGNNANPTTTTIPPSGTNSLPSGHHQQQAIPNGELCNTLYTTTYNNNNNTSNTSSTNMLSTTSSNNDSIQLQSPTDQADISYRVSSGCRQITIFGDHDVDIKFRGDCVTINKIDVDYPT